MHSCENGAPVFPNMKFTSTASCSCRSFGTFTFTGKHVQLYYLPGGMYSIAISEIFDSMQLTASYLRAQLGVNANTLFYLGIKEDMLQIWNIKSVAKTELVSRLVQILAQDVTVKKALCLMELLASVK